MLAGGQYEILRAMVKVSVLSAVTLTLATTVVAHAGPSVPNLSLEVTVQARENGKLSAGFHINQISCWKNECSLEVLTLNQCFNFSTGSMFHPVIERYTTAQGDLEVSFRGTRLNARVKKVTPLVSGEIRFNLTFVLREEQSQKSTRWELVDFVGGFTTTYDDGRVVAVEFVPLRSPTTFVHAKLDCAVSLPALEGK